MTKKLDIIMNVPLSTNFSIQVGDPSQITFAFRGGEVVRKMLNLLRKKCKLGGTYVVKCQKKANVICEGSLMQIYLHF